LEDQIKQIARDAGADLVGITIKDYLSGNQCADPTYYLPTAESVIGFAVALDKEIVREFLGKKNGEAQVKMSRLEGETYHKIERIGEAIKKFLESKGYEAVNCEANMDYRRVKRRNANQTIDQMKRLVELIETDPNNPFINFIKSRDKLYDSDLTPKLSHRYVAVACGIGRLGWSGNLITPEYGALVYLGSVVTNAKLDPDPPLKENPCNQCKICTTVCQGQLVDSKESQSVKIGEIEETIGKKHALSKCVLSCGGFTGQSRFKEWGTWSPWRVDIPKEDNEADKVLNQTFKEFLLAGGLRAQNVLRLSMDTQLGFGKAVKAVDDFRVYCAFCQLVCGASEEIRRENRELIRASGVVKMDDKGKIIIKQ
jgi:epoxyqueuosine reductase